MVTKFVHDTIVNVRISSSPASETTLANDHHARQDTAPLPSSPTDGTSHSSNKPSSKKGKILWWTAAAIGVALLFVMIRFLPLEQLMSGIKEWIDGLGYWGPLALGALYILATVLFIPGTILSLAAGGLFGLWLGFAIISLASTIGAAAAFLIARYLARKRVAKMVKNNRHLDALDRAIGEGGWKVVGLLRLSPAIPFNVQNYLYGVTSIEFWPCVLTSWVAMMPGTFLYIYIGHVSGAALGQQRQRSTAEWVMLGVGLLATIAVTVYVTRLAKRKLGEQVTH